MVFGYELQKAKGSAVQVHVCHPGASQTGLLDGEDRNWFLRHFWGLVAPLIAQSAEQGAWPQLMCATEQGLQSRTYYGPLKRGETVGPVGECELHDFVLEPQAAERLWTLSEEKTAHTWSI